MAVWEAESLKELRTDPQISGLAYHSDFIDAETEAALLEYIDAQPWLMDLKRRVQHYGYRYDYRARNIARESRLGAVPSWLMSCCIRLKEERIFQAMPEQVIVNEYWPGQGISPHIDCVPCFGPVIASLSLGSACVMNFRHAASAKKVSILLEPRSMLVLSGEARSAWQHAISPRKTDICNGQVIPRARRVSLTFRTIRSGFTDNA